MGLDMYAYKTKTPISEISGNAQSEDEILQYWRKHPNLHGYMEKLWRSKHDCDHGTEFNCVPVELTRDDLEHLKYALDNNKLPETTGFFFGKSRPEETAQDYEFIRDAMTAIKEGFYVYYTSWW
jgi:hypothetical protein